MQDPSVSEMALNAAFDSINAAQKSLEKGLNHPQSSDLPKKGNQKSTASLKDLGISESQKPYSDTKALSTDLIGGKLHDQNEAQLSESQQPYTNTVENTLSPRALSSMSLDQQSKSVLALQIANDAISNALASQDKLASSKEPRNDKRAKIVNTPLLLEKKKIMQDKRAITDAKIKQASKITPAEIQSQKTLLDTKKENREAKIKQLSSIKSPDLRLRKDMINKKKDEHKQSKSVLALQIANDAISNALASQDKLASSKEPTNDKRAKIVNTPLLLEKKKIMQDKRAITDAKIKQASKITPAEIQSQKTLLDTKKENREAKIKQLSSIKSPDLRLRKDMINKKKDDQKSQQEPQEDLSETHAESIFALGLAEEAIQSAQKAFSDTATHGNPPLKIQEEKKAESIQQLQTASEALKNAQQVESSKKMDRGEVSTKDSVNIALLEAHKSLENLTHVLVDNQKDNFANELKPKSEADLCAADLTNAAISSAEKSLQQLNNAIRSEQQNTIDKSNNSQNIKTLEENSKVKQKETQKQPSHQVNDSVLKKEKVQQKANNKKQKMLPKLDKMKESIMNQFAKISPKLRPKKKSHEEKGNKAIEPESEYKDDFEDETKPGPKAVKPIKKSAMKEKKIVKFAKEGTKNPPANFEYKDDFEEVPKGSLKGGENARKSSEAKAAHKPLVVKAKVHQNVKHITGKLNFGGKKKVSGSVITNKKESAASDERKEELKDSQAKNTRTLLSQQKKNFQIKIGQLKHRIKLLKYQRNPQLDPSIEAKYFPQLARQPYLKSSSGVISSRVTDSFALNPPSWKDGIERPKTAPRQRTNTGGYGGDEMETVATRPRTAPPAKTQNLDIGARVCVLLNGQRCLGSLQYYGNFDHYDFMWCGIELDRPLGTHNGVFKNVRYFECPESHGLFVKADRLIPLRSKIPY